MLMLGAWQVTLLGIFFVLVCLFMMLIILIQKPRGGGLSGAFGGAGSAQAAFGAKTGDVLTWFTVICFTAFLLLAIGLTWMIKPSDQLDAQALVPADAPPNASESIPATEDNQTTPSGIRKPTDDGAAAPQPAPAESEP